MVPTFAYVFLSQERFQRIGGHELWKYTLKAWWNPQKWTTLIALTALWTTELFLYICFGKL